MEHTVSQLARLSGVSARTLRYYDQIDLLKPNRINSSGYRIYGQAEIDLLQQILFYRELKLPLDDIKKILLADDFDLKVALRSHLVHLTNQRKRLDNLILTVEKSLQEKEGGHKMSEKEKFEAFKQTMIEENEKQFGDEMREKHGDDVISKANEKVQCMSRDDWNNHEELTAELNRKLAEATKQGDPTSQLAQEVAALHKIWLSFSWPDGLYDVENHLQLSKMYIEDARFKAYYDKIEPGSAEFLHAALKKYLNN